MKAKKDLVFGLQPEKGRWVFVGLGLVALLCMGTAYSWTIFRGPLREMYGLTATQSLLPFTVLLVMYALLMPVAGRWMERIGVRRTLLLGAGMVGVGYFLAGHFAAPWGLVVFYGGLVGAGIGVGYGVPLAVSARWFPDRKGLALGVTVVGFGLSPFFTAPLAKQLVLMFGVMRTFQILGLLFGVILAGIALLMRFPEAHWHPAGVPGVDTGAAAALTDLPPVWKMRGFWPLWVTFMIGTFVGLSAIGISSAVAEQVAGINPVKAAGFVSLFALFNGGGRPVFGWLTDRIGPAATAAMIFGMILLACGMMFFFGEGRVSVYVISFCLFWLCLGAWMALAPAATARMFPAAGYPRYYGVVFTAYGAGALLGTLSAGTVRDLFGSYRFAFVPMAVLALAGVLVALLGLRRPKPPATSRP